VLTGHHLGPDLQRGDVRPRPGTGNPCELVAVGFRSQGNDIVAEGDSSEGVAGSHSGRFPRLTAWIGFDDDLPLKASHRAFIQLLAPHLSDQQIDGCSGRADVDPDGAELPLRGGPVAPLEMRGR
jgi:hypothetical protein